MSLLFDAPLIAGLRYQEDVLTAPQEADLIHRLGTLDLSPFKFQGWLGNRKTRTFGWRYDFDDSNFAPAEPIPAWLDGPREQAAKFAGLAADDFIHVLLARYDPGPGIGWHRDRDVFEDVVGFSLGTPAVLRFRQRSEAGFRRVNIDLPPRSIYLLSGEARHEWEHRIVPGDRLRFSITFRTLSEKGRRVVSRTGG